MTIVAALTLILVAYGLGCFTTGHYLARLRSNTTDRNVAGSDSDNLSPWEFVLSFIIDLAKGAAPVLAARVLHLPPLGIVACTIAVVGGHLWPVQLEFNGGKGIAPMTGALLAFDHNIVLLLLLAVAILHLTNKQLMLSGLSGVALVPLFAAMLSHSALEIAGLAILTLLVLWAHRDEIKEILTAYGYVKRTTE
jgi:glycerol-3-phosphate acyltransferase PlsY